MKGPTWEIASFASKTTFNDLPASAVEKCKRIVLDSIGVGLGGYVLDELKITLQFVRESGGRPEATIIGGGKTSAPLAAFANADLINALEFDAIGPLSAHVVPYAVSPCLAVAEKEHRPGKDLILAIALAHEIAGRVVTSMAQHRVLKGERIEEGERMGYAAAVFGAAAGAGSLLRLNANKMAHALGIAGGAVPSPALLKWQNTPTPTPMVKYNCWPGWTAQLATTAALLADNGFTGDTTILDGDWGFWKIYGSPTFNAGVITGGLAKVWHLDEVRTKIFPCCYLHATSIMGLRSLVRENRINPDDIESIVVKANSYLQTPVRKGKLVGPMDASICNDYLFAVTCYHGDRPGPLWHSVKSTTDPKIKALMKKVRVEVHPQDRELTLAALKNGRPFYHTSMVEITAGGRKFATEVKPYQGVAPHEPMTDEQVIQKFKDNASYSSLNPGKLDEIIDLCHNLEKVKDVSRLCNLLVVE